MDPLLVLPKKLVLGTSTFFALVLASMTFAAPLRNTTTGANVFKHETTLGPMVFGTEPQGRGTWGIIFSCTTTYAFCIWTAVHPNVIPNASSGYRLFYKGVLMVISIINPEGIAVFAYGQLVAARDLKRQWEKDLEDMAVKKHWADDMYEARKRKYSFNMQVAFFIVMGGFTIDESTEESNMHLRSKHIEELHKRHIIYAPKEGGANERKKSKFTATLTPAGFLKYANEGYFDECSFNELEGMVKDKGKASNIAKIFSATQALWLGVQCVARKAAGLPLSLLEIHVLIQVCCTVIIYLCWWNKPLDVNEPIRLLLKKGEGEEDKLQPIRTKPATDLLKDEVVELGPDSELPMLRDYTITRCPPCLLAMSDRALYDIIVNITGAAVRTKKAEKTDSTEAAVRTEKTEKTDSTKAAMKTEKPDSIGVAVRIEETDSTGAVDGTRSPMGMMILEGMTIAIIAGLHVVASKNYFPTETEARLWRMACIGMCVCPLVVIVCASLSPSKMSYHVALAKMLWHNHQVQYTPWQWVRQEVVQLYVLAEAQTLGDQNKKVLKYFHLLILVTCVLLLGGYVACILYITVASYISLRDPPDGTFVTPRWGDYWPHL